jgi:transport and Golgi organization protein 2
MCTVVLSIEPGLPVLVAGVRDELHDRAWEPPGRHWPQYQGLIGGRDLLAGGTWLAVSPDDLRVACVLNGIGQPAPAATRRSRGVLPLVAAAGKPLDRVMLADLDPFLLVVAEPDRASVQTWDGRHLAERALPAGLHMIVNSGLASQTSDGEQPRADLAGGTSPGAERTFAQSPAAQPRAAQPSAAQPPAAQPPDGREHEVARVRHFLRRFGSAARPDPRPGMPLATAWGEWFPLVNGDGIGPDDRRALIVRRDLGDARTWGTTSISLVALAPGRLRYDFTGRPGDQAAWYSVL